MSDTNRDRDRHDRNDRQERRGLSLGTAALAGIAVLVGGFVLRFLRGNHPDAPAASRPDSRKTDTLPEGHVDRADLEAGYEKHDVSVRAAVLAIIALVIVTGLVVGAITGMQVLLTDRIPDLSPPAAGVDDAPREPVPDRVQSRAASGEEYQQLRAAEDELLSSYGWVNQGEGVVHIPIERAMELIAERGLPTRPEGEEVRDTGLEIPLDSSSGRVPDRVYDYWRGD